MRRGEGGGVQTEHRHVDRVASNSWCLEEAWSRAPHGGTRRPGCLSTYIADGLLIRHSREIAPAAIGTRQTLSWSSS